MDKAELYIARVNVGSGDDVVRIEARDGPKLLGRIEVSIEGFARAVLGIAGIPAKFSTVRELPAHNSRGDNGDQVQGRQ